MNATTDPGNITEPREGVSDGWVAY